MLRPFHLAIPVTNLEVADKFYGELLGFKKGRTSSHWIDFDFFGHQLVVHLSEHKNHIDHNEVDTKQVPIPHFGVVLGWEEWHSFSEKCQELDFQFIIEPGIRFKGTAGEQATMFFSDPFGNALEFKAFKDPSKLFAPFDS